MAFALLAAYVRSLQLAVRGVAPSAGQWAMMVSLVLIGMFRMEVRKLTLQRGA